MKKAKVFRSTKVAPTLVSAFQRASFANRFKCFIPAGRPCANIGKRMVILGSLRLEDDGLAALHLRLCQFPLPEQRIGPAAATNGFKIRGRIERQRPVPIVDGL